MNRHLLTIQTDFNLSDKRRIRTFDSRSRSFAPTIYGTETSAMLKDDVINAMYEAPLVGVNVILFSY